MADAAWNAGAYAGLSWIRDSLGVPVSHLEARTPAEQEEALRTYAAQGYDLVFGHGFEFQGAAERVSAAHPKTAFIITSGERVQGKVAPLVFRIEEGTFLAGMVAGAMTRTGKLGFVGGIELPPIKRGYQGWVRGAQRINPKVETRVAYLNTFDDAAAGREWTCSITTRTLPGWASSRRRKKVQGFSCSGRTRTSPSSLPTGCWARLSSTCPGRFWRSRGR